MKRFKKIYIEITNICNLSCSFCPRTEREKAFMSPEDFEHIIKEIKPYTDYVYFHVKGEPLLHPGLSQFLDICWEYGMKVNITTNGTLIMTALEALKGKEALRQVNFSLHSFGGGEEDEELYLEHILTGAGELLKTTKANISYRFWNLDRKEEEDATDGYLESLSKTYEVKGSLKEMVAPGRGIKLAERVYISRDYEFSWPSLKEQEDEGIGFCYGLRTHAGVLVDSTVIPCCLDGEGIINLGNLKESSFHEIMESKRARELYDGFSGRKAVEELCRKCGYRKKFS